MLDPLEEAPSWELESKPDAEENIQDQEDHDIQDPDTDEKLHENPNPWSVAGRGKREKISPLKLSSRRKRDPVKLYNFLKGYLIGTATEAYSLTCKFTSELDEMLNDRVGDSRIASALSL